MKNLLLLAIFVAVFTVFAFGQSQLLFTGNPNNPVLGPGESGTWDAGGVFTASCVLENGTTYMFYSGWNNPFGSSLSIGLATSENGFEFSKVTVETPLLEGDGSGFDALSVSDPVIFKDGPDWILFYSGIESSSEFIGKAIGKATASDANGPYTRINNPILETGNSGEWDSYFIFPSCVLSTDNGYIMYYWAGDGYPSGIWCIGLATSQDGVTWAKYDDPLTTEPPYSDSDPVLIPGEIGEWDRNGLIGCTVSETADGYEMIYAGTRLGSAGALGYATSEDGIIWVKDEENNPVYKWTDDPYASEHLYHVVEIPTLILNDGTYFVYYDYGPQVGEIGMATALSSANIVNVPGDQPTIQTGIDAAIDGNIVLVEEGTYYENIRFKGKAITVASNYILDGDSSHIVNTIIDGSQPTNSDSAAVVMFVNDEDTTSVINGFTLNGGSGVYESTWKIRAGGGIYCWGAGCKIINNIITENHVEDEDRAGGAGILCGQDAGEDNLVIIRENYIGYNTSLAHGFSAFGGGMSILTDFIIENNLVENNICTNTYGTSDGGGIELETLPGINQTGTVNSNIIRNNELISKSHVLGAGIVCSGLQDVEIRDNLIEYNTGTADTNGRGGGIWIKGTNNCLIEDNAIQFNELNGNNVTMGGGIYGAYNLNVEFNQNTVSNNTCNAKNGAWGGGIATYEIDTIGINFNLIEYNLANSTHGQAGGGAIDLLKTGKTEINDNEIINNTVNLASGYKSWGGGILIDKATDTVFISKNLISNNTVGKGQTGHGGGICFYTTTDIVAYVNSNLITNNISDYRGGGLYTRNTYEIFVQNNLFDGNESGKYGGAIMFDETVKKTTLDGYSHPVIANNTFTWNSSEYGGAIYSKHDDEVPVVFNSIFWKDSAVYSQDIYNWGGTEMPIYNNVIDTEEIITPWTGAENFVCNPTFLDDLLHLHFDSHCLNAGTASVFFIDRQYKCPETDFDGDERPYNGTIPDIGADEAPYTYVYTKDQNETTTNPLTISPNPFTFSTQIAYDLSSPQFVSISIFNHLGELVDVLLNEHQLKRKHTLAWHPETLPSGIYFCVLKSGNETSTSKMIKLK